MTTVHGDDRRQHIRYACNIPVKMITWDGAFDGVSVDISLGGLRVVAHQAFSTGQELTVQFKVPTMASEVRVGACVRWVVGHFIGLQFTSVSSEATLACIALINENRLMVLE